MHKHYYANANDKAHEQIYNHRESDWRNGALVYQVLVDRFAPPKDLGIKKHLYPAPKTLHTWQEKPKAGHYIESEQLWSHEIAFWGGDLNSLSSRLDYIRDLGVDVLYLNPIHLGYTNHKYDSLDYQVVSPEFGTREDVKNLTCQVHKNGMKIVLDGVFNHMGQNSYAFKQAQADTQSPYRNWFYFDDSYSRGYRAWADAQNLPELNLENPAVREHIYASPGSVVQSYLDDGIDGWRLDVAFDLGFNYLEELTHNAHRRKPGSLVVGELWNYPKEWFPSVDGVMNFTAREIIARFTNGTITAQTASKMLERMIDDAGIENMLKSWLILDNHDTPRLTNMLNEQSQQRLAQVLQFTLPGSPNLYYGTELGMTGGDDPAMRAPMRWDLVNENNATLTWTRELIKLRKACRALKVGDYRSCISDKLLAFERYTNQIEDTVVVVCNPTNETIRESVLVTNSKLMNFELLVNQLNPEQKLPICAGIIDAELGPQQAAIFTVHQKPKDRYSPYKRVM